MHIFFQTSFGIPAEGVYTGLIGFMLFVIGVLLFIISMMARRNVRLVEDNRQITTDSIKGFRDVIAALNATREHLQVFENAIMGKFNSNEAKIKERLLEVQGNLASAQKEILSHLQYLRDRSR